uniref:Uncharacterized protein n=1 Tax=Anguilla anguilla TaxID=7936 RepID=A0A0E9SDM3_ANGAN
MDVEDDCAANTAIAFIFLFLITLFYGIGATAIKVKWGTDEKKYVCVLLCVDSACSNTSYICKYVFLLKQHLCVKDNLL